MNQTWARENVWNLERPMLLVHGMLAKAAAMLCYTESAASAGTCQWHSQ